MKRNPWWYVSVALALGCWYFAQKTVAEAEAVDRLWLKLDKCEQLRSEGK